MTANAEIVLEEHARTHRMPSGRHLRRTEERVRRCTGTRFEDRAPEGGSQSRHQQRHGVLEGLKPGDRSSCLRSSWSAGRRSDDVREAVFRHFRICARTSCAAFLPMFGILWGMVSVVVLSATGGGFRRATTGPARTRQHRHRLGRTNQHAGRGERAGRQIFLTIGDGAPSRRSRRWWPSSARADAERSR
jgi:hypothetical protein